MLSSSDRVKLAGGLEVSPMGVGDNLCTHQNTQLHKPTSADIGVSNVWYTHTHTHTHTPTHTHVVDLCCKYVCAYIHSFTPKCRRLGMGRQTVLGLRRFATGVCAGSLQHSRGPGHQFVRHSRGVRIFCFCGLIPTGLGLLR
jgi:hypothetical protein